MTAAQPVALANSDIAEVLKELHHHTNYHFLAERQGMNLCGRAAQAIETLLASDARSREASVQ